MIGFINIYGAKVFMNTEDSTLSGTDLCAILFDIEVSEKVTETQRIIAYRARTQIQSIWMDYDSKETTMIAPRTAITIIRRLARCGIVHEIADIIESGIYELNTGIDCFVDMITSHIGSDSNNYSLLTSLAYELIDGEPGVNLNPSQKHLLAKEYKYLETSLILGTIKDLPDVISAMENQKRDSPIAWRLK
jgi:hypothetical protein